MKSGLILKSVFILSLVSGACFDNVHAESTTDSQPTAKSSTKVNVNQKSIPSEVQKLAEENYISRVTTLDKVNNQSSDGYTLGEPFKIYKFDKKSDGNYYFPVLNEDGDIKYIVTVSPKVAGDSAKDGKYSLNVSAFLSKTLNEYKNQKITILTDSNGYYVLGEKGSAKLVLSTPHETKDFKVKDKADQAREFKRSEEKAPKSDELKGLNETASITKPVTKLHNPKYASDVEYVNKLKNFSIRETQGYNGWCAGYTMSALLNATYNTDRYNAEGVMRYIHPDLTGDEFLMTGLTEGEMINFGRSQGRSPELLKRMTSYGEVDQLTKDNKGIAVLGESVEKYENGLHGYHAMAVVGNAKVDNGQEVILIWNPWDSNFMTQDANSNVIPVSDGHHYRWYSSIYGY